MEESVRNFAYRLVSMNSDQGDWFFEELISLNANQNELLTLISKAAPSFYRYSQLKLYAHLRFSIKTSPSFNNLLSYQISHVEVDDIRLTATVYQSLGRLHREWKSHIVPESVTLVQIEESTQLVDAIITLAHNQPLHQIGQHLR